MPVLPSRTDLALANAFVCALATLDDFAWRRVLEGGAQVDRTAWAVSHRELSSRIDRGMMETALAPLIEMADHAAHVAVFPEDAGRYAIAATLALALSEQLLDAELLTLYAPFQDVLPRATLVPDLR